MAIELGEKWLNENPAHPRVLCSLASAYQKAGNLEAARARFQQTLEVDDRDVVALVSLGNLELQSGNLEAARAHFKQTLEIDGRDVVALNSLGNLEFQSGNLEAARTRFQQTLKIDDRNVVAKYLCAVIDFKKGDLPKGLQGLVSILREGFNTHAMGLLKKLAINGIGTNTYRQIFIMMEHTQAIQPSDLPKWEIALSLKEVDNPAIPINEIMPDIEEEAGRVARSQIFQLDGRIPQPINTTAFVVSHNRRPFSVA